MIFIDEDREDGPIEIPQEFSESFIKSFESNKMSDEFLDECKKSYMKLKQSLSRARQ